ncbi:rhomboid family intramembrane serine protease [Sphingobacteriaceae bacterium WQ 2009]|uniref:Rhomboid family intramembrane serine protease n=1 Tax=Rhinopithecimicrobium faecis TaxID=2820698 RepID=A0A8T4HCF0_9SPHI|nr:rhomboid family intramembrane serine protease [Sphingobacteriaceae bacterium WQ 2009]
MRDNALKNFWRDVFMTGSPIPYIILAQVTIFIVIHLFDLLLELQLIQVSLYDRSVSYLAIPRDFQQFLKQPWSLLSYSFTYVGLFKILFDCMWLYWIGNLFLTFLNRRQFLFIYISTVLLTAVVYLGVAQIPYFQQSIQGSLMTATASITALLIATATLIPQYELRLFLFGNVRLKTLAIVITAIEFIFFFLTNKPASIALLASGLFGFACIKMLQSGRDWSAIFKKSARRKSKLRVVHSQPIYPRSKSVIDLPNQEEIDQILDKISLSGYESLTSHEKEILFRASRKSIKNEKE